MYNTILAFIGGFVPKFHEMKYADKLFKLAHHCKDIRDIQLATNFNRTEPLCLLSCFERGARNPYLFERCNLETQAKV